jgi:hypothetical protein
MRNRAVTTLTTPPVNSGDVREEVKTLTLRLAAAEQQHELARDRYRAQTDNLAAGRRANVAGALRDIEQAAALTEGIRSQLENKKAELAEMQRIESEAAAAHRHQQHLEALGQITTDEAHAKAEVIRLQRELSTLPGRLQLAQARHSEILRARVAVKQELGL